MSVADYFLLAVAVFAVSFAISYVLADWRSHNR